MKPQGDYHPPQGWVKFDTLKAGETFHDIEASAPGFSGSGPVQYLKLDTGQAAGILGGKVKTFDHDEFVRPVNAGWIAEFENFGFRFPQEVIDGGPSRMVAYVVQRTEATKANEQWRKEIEKHYPELGFHSFSSPTRVVKWLIDRIKRDDAQV